MQYTPPAITPQAAARQIQPYMAFGFRSTITSSTVSLTISTPPSYKNYGALLAMEKRIARISIKQRNGVVYSTTMKFKQKRLLYRLVIGMLLMVDGPEIDALLYGAGFAKIK